MLKTVRNMLEACTFSVEVGETRFGRRPMMTVDAPEGSNPRHLKTMLLCLTAEIEHAARADEDWVAQCELASPTRGYIYFEPAEDDQGRALGLLQSVAG